MATAQTGKERHSGMWAMWVCCLMLVVLLLISLFGR